MYSSFHFSAGTLLALALCAGVSAQTVTSSLVGTVVDQQDAVVVSAPVVLTNAGTGQVRQAVTDTLGSYRFVNLEPGTYNVTVKAPGFKSETQTGIEVVAQETITQGGRCCRSEVRRTRSRSRRMRLRYNWRVRRSRQRSMDTICRT